MKVNFPIKVVLAAPAYLLLTTLFGCQSPATNPETEQSISLATGVNDAVTFRVDGMPLDEPGADAAILTIADAVGRALRTSPELQVALARVRIALADADQARLLPNPFLNIVFRFVNGGGRPNFEIGLSEELLSILQRPGRVRAADARLQSASAEAVATSILVVSNVEHRYAAAQAAQELLPILNGRRDVFDRLISLAKARLEAGEGTRLDRTLLEAERIELELSMSEQEARLRDEKLSLAKLVGEPSHELLWSVEKWTAPPLLQSTEREWIELALKKRPELWAREWELAALGDEQSLTKLAWLDGLAAGANAERDDKTSAGPSVTIPLPLFDTGRARTAKAEALVIEARHQYTMTQRDVVEDVRRAYSAFVNSIKNLKRAQNELIPILQQRRDLVEANYRAGQTDSTFVLLAEQELQSAFAKRIELEELVTVSLLKLKKAAGGAGVAQSLQNSNDK